MLLSVGMSKDIFRALTLPDGNRVENVEIDTASAHFDKATELSPYADLVAAVFSGACRVLGVENDRKSLEGKLHLEVIPVERNPNYIHLIVTGLFGETLGGRILYGYNPNYQRLTVEFNDLNDDPVYYNAQLAQAMLGVLENR